MALTIKWFARLIAAGLFLTVFGAVIIVYLMSRSLPEYDKTIEISGINSPIEIVRDTANVPHILGESDNDVFFGLGYVHAQDRLWQMSMLRQTVQGRLSEVFGKRTFEIDELMRRLDLYTIAQQSIEDQSPQTIDALRAYAAGINARIAEINDNALGRGAPEMFVFDMPFAPWQPTDSIALMKLMAFQLSSNMSNEVLRAKTLLALPDPNMIEDIIPKMPGQGGATELDFSTYINGDPSSPTRYAQIDFGSFLPMAETGMSGASNAFVAHANRSAAGGPILANDPHLGLSAPSLFYLARIELKTGGVIGATMPGIPIVLMGRSKDFAWGITSSYADDQDLFIEEVNPNNLDQFRAPTGWRPFKVRDSIIQIKGEAPKTIKLKWSDNGPVIPPNLYSVADITPDNHVMSLSWTALNSDDTSVTAGLEMMRVKSVTQAFSILKGFSAPSLNITMTDGTDIAFQIVGDLPQRNINHDSQGRLPSFGWIEHNRWSGIKPKSDNPTFLNPDSGILGNTNNKTVDDPFPNHVSFDWGDSQRVQRWSRLMSNRKVHTRESFIEAMLDTVSVTARNLLPLIAKDLWFTSTPAQSGTIEYEMQIALDLLANWNGEMNEHLPEPLIYATWMRALQTRLIQDELGTLEPEFRHPRPVFIERVYKNIDGASKWCDIMQSTPIETCSEIAHLALQDAIVWLRDKYGVRVDSLRWGNVHQAAHDHSVLGKVPIMNYFVNIRQSVSGGDNTLLRAKTLGKGDDPFLNVHGSVYRGVYDFSDPDSSVFIISTGQSGHWLSRHYDDMAQLWRRGEFVPMSLDENLARAAATGITILRPLAP